MNNFKFKKKFHRNNISILKRNINSLTAITNLTEAAFSIPMLNCSFEGF